MKKLVTVIMIILVLFGCVACVEYNDAVNKPGQGNQSGNNNNNNNNNNDNQDTPNEQEGELSTVTLMYNGEFYQPSIVIKAQWDNGFSVRTAEFDDNGEAKIYGLDGEYDVTLSALPKGYSYNPNIYYTSNERRHIEIELFKVTETVGTGKGLYHSEGVIVIDQTAVYRAELESAKDVVYYEFAPQKSGTYTIESWVDTTAELVNPMADVYEGSIAYKNFSYTINTGGKEGTFSKNFVYDVEIADEMISENGSAVFTFGIKATVKTDKFPVYVDFAIKLDGMFDLDHTISQYIVPQENFVRAEEVSGTLSTPARQVGSNYLFDQSMYKLNPADGYYYLYDAETDTYVQKLYAFISKPCFFITDRAFSEIEYAGNKNLTVNKGKDNYKIFIEGAAATIAAGYDNVPTALQNQEGYAQYTNSDGVYPVTEELKIFLQAYSTSQELFKDGNGFVESFTTPRYYCDEDSQWLFGCALYK